MDYPKSTPNVGLVGGKFVDENVTTGIPGSLIPAAWGNAVTDEVLAVIKAAGIVPAEGDLTQLLKAIQAIAASDIKRSVRVATTGPIALSGLQTIDAVALKAGDRVLAKDQANASQNWIYTVAAGAWVRALDANESAECTPGHLVIVEAGTAHGGSLWQLSNTTLPTLGTTTLTFARVFGKTGVAAGDYRKVTVDPQGRVTGGSNPNTAAGYGLTDVYTIAEANSLLAATGWVVGGVALPAGVNLDTITTPGSYGQSSNGGASLAMNFPEALAGTLLVQAAGTGLITQTYSVRGPSNRKYERNLYANVWSAWTDVANTASVRAMLTLYGLGSGWGGTVPATQEELASLPSGNYYYPSTISPYPTLAFVQRMVYGTNRGFEIGNVPYQKRIFGRASNNDGTWMAPFELANLDSPTFTGTPTVPTPAKGNSSKLAANTEFVQVAVSAAVAALVDSSPALLDTFKEIATALGNDPNFATSMMNALAGKADKATSLAGYGILDAYTKTQVESLVTSKTAKATQDEVDTGNSDAGFVTPSKMRWGFNFIKGGGGANNAIVFPSWLGGLMIQWGVHLANTVDAETTVTFPLGFNIVPALVSGFSHDGTLTQSGVVPQARLLTANGFQSRREDVASGTTFSGTAYIRWLAIGY